MSEKEMEIQNKKIEQLDRLIALAQSTLKANIMLINTLSLMALTNQSITLEQYRDNVLTINTLLNEV